MGSHLKCQYCIPVIYLKAQEFSKPQYCEALYRGLEPEVEAPILNSAGYFLHDKICQDTADPCYSECDPGTNTWGITQELIENAESEALAQISRIRIYILATSPGELSTHGNLRELWDISISLGTYGTIEKTKDLKSKDALTCLVRVTV